MRKNYYQALALFGAFFLWSASSMAASIEVDDVIQNISNSAINLPGLLAALCYIAALIMITWALFKTMDHVNNPSQVPIRAAAVRFLVGGGLFAIPILTEAVIRTINGGAVGGGVAPLDAINTIFAVMTIPLLVPVALNLNVFMGNILGSIDFLPGMVAIVGYLLAILLTVSATFKVREHVDDPDRVGLREPVIRYLVAGALFALPTVFEAMYTTIAGGGLGLLAGLDVVALNAMSFILSSDDGSALPACAPIVGSPISLASVMCLFLISTSFMPIFLSAISYFLGLVFGVWGIMKIRDHVLNPSQTRLNEGIMRFIAGGAFFAMPYVATVLQSSVTSTPLTVLMLGATAAGTNTGFTGTANIATCTAAALLGANSLDMALSCFMINILGPSQALLNFFCFVAGLILTMIGISRLVRSSQEGVKGPGGRGTVATFVAAGILMSANTIIRAFSASFFALPITLTSANLAYTGGMSPAEIAAAQNVMSAVLRFMIIVGLISFVRGIFIVREVADGGQQASLMSGMTHIIGGAFAVNLGPLLNFVQGTLGITTFGATFT